MEVGEQENPRRKFIVNAGKTSVLLASGAVALSGCSDKEMAPELTRGKSPKKEVLYQKSAYWDAYYNIAH